MYKSVIFFHKTPIGCWKNDKNVWGLLFAALCTKLCRWPKKLAVNEKCSSGWNASCLRYSYNCSNTTFQLT